MDTKIEKQIIGDGDVSKEDDELIFDPYNPLNKTITEEQVSAILLKYGVPSKVHNIELYKRAFVHKSYCKRPHIENIQNNITLVDKPPDCLPLKTKSNERLEFLGDGVLECITKYYLYRRFPKENEGFMTEKKIAIVKNETIGKFAYDMGLNNWYIMSKNAEEKKTRTNLKKLGCLFEAFLGALFLDFNKISIHDDDKWFDNVFVTGPGFQIAQIFVESIFEAHINWTELLMSNDNYKNLLQVKLQKAFQVTPIYKEIEEYDEEEGYHMGVYLSINIDSHNMKHDESIHYSEFQDDASVIDAIKYYLENTKDSIYMFLGESKHKIKKKAEQEACRLAIQNLNNQNKE